MKKHPETWVKGIAAAMTAAALLFAAPNGYADTPGKHPFYMHARADLRRAEQLMEVRDEPNVMRDLKTATHEAHAAIHELDAAALWDRKDVEENPSVDIHTDRSGRFRAIEHIDQAIQSVRRAARDDWRDDWLK